MYRKVNFLTPINVDTPPAHTQVYPLCATCKSFPVCNLRLDYMKTLFLIEQILGDPQEDLELHKSNPNFTYMCYEGTPIENPETIFPVTLIFNKRILPSGQVLTENIEGTLVSAKYQDLDVVLFLYNTEGYQVMFKALYNTETKEYEIKDGIERVYGIIYEFPSDSVLEVQVNLGAWREEMEAKINHDADLINTTYFSARLDCKFYEGIRGLSPEEGFRRMIAEFPEGIPDGNGNYYHLETIHIEPNKVPIYNPNAGKVAFAPIPLPVWIPKPCKKANNPLYRYGDKDD